MQKYRLLAPGPVPLPKRVLKALAEPALHHRTPLFNHHLEFCFSELQKVFQTSQPVLIQTATGSGVMESAVVNTLSPEDEVLCIVGGKFGERWVQIAQSYGIKVHRFDVSWGEALELDQLEAKLKEQTQVKAVLFQACETSTGTLFPVQAISQLVDQICPEALVIVDAITAMGCFHMPMEEWNLDVVVAGSQKAFMLPTGLGFIGVSEKALLASRESQCPKFYWDWSHELKNYPQATRFSSANSLIRALSEVLHLFSEVGMKTVYERCQNLAETSRWAASELGLEVFSSSPSPSVTAIQLPHEVEGEKLRLWLEEERNVTVMGGQDQLKNRILRVGHMGAITNEDMKVFFQNLGEGLKKPRSSDFEDELSKRLQASEEFFL